jgi:hypothetical protein
VGILQNDTNNIILDAVLTNKGRELIARSDNSFSIVKFAISDEEVDYSIIQKYGRTVGKEKIEKNTPVFEALTNQSLAQKYRCVSVSNPNLLRLPSLALTGEGVDSTSTVLSIGNTTVRSRNISLSQTITNESSIDIELRDQSFVIELDNRFLQISGRAADDVDSQQRAKYIIPRDAGETSLGGSRVSFTVSTKAISESQFTIFGASYNKNLISTFVKVSGIQSGAVKEFEVQISKSS